MKSLKSLTVLLAALTFATGLLAANVFPVFETNAVSFTVPTSLPGCVKDLGHQIGTNYVYNLNGELFSDKDGQIQTTAEGFDGQTDESTPWKTLSELLAFYQAGGSEEEMKSLYDNTSSNFIKMVYGNEQIKGNLKSWGHSMAGMNVILAFEYSNGYLAFVQINYKDGHHQALPFFFTLTGHRYKVSAKNDKKPAAAFLNIGLYLNKQLAPRAS